MPISHQRQKQPKEFPALQINRARDQTVSYALQAVQQIVDLGNPTPLAMMMVAMPLRALFIDGNGGGYLNLTAQSHKTRLPVPQPRADFLRENLPLSRIKFGMCGDVWAWDKIIGGFICVYAGVERKPHVLPASAGRAPIAEFLDQTVLIVSGVKVTRAQVITYVANKVGFGHHNDSRESEVSQALDTARDVYGFDETSTANLKISYDERPLERIREPFTAFAGRVDSVLMQIFITCKFLMDTPKLADLRAQLDAV